MSERELGCDVTGAIFLGADLRGADLRGAVGLTMEQLRGARLDAHTRLPRGLASPGDGSACPLREIDEADRRAATGAD